MQVDFKQPYEISLWEDVLTFVTNIGEFEGALPEDKTYNVITQYYKEKKKLILGGDKITSPLRAFNPKLTRNVNGSITLTFQIFNRYYDEESDQYLNNPFVKDLVNERKVKLRVGTEENNTWYDFVIKDVSEDSKTEVFTYTAKSLFINELSKTGFDLEFDTKLGNNIGNLYYLGDQVLKGSDWKLNHNGLLLKQKREEPLYVGVLKQSIDADNLETKEKITIPKGQIIYIFYSVMENQESYFQFIWSKDKLEKDSKNVITNENINWHIEVTYEPDTGEPLYINEPLLEIGIGLKVSDEYRGGRLVRKPITKFDPSVKKYVNLFDLNGAEIYGFKKTEYASPTVVSSYVTNSSDYTSTTGWEVGNLETKNDLPKLSLTTAPDLRAAPSDYTGDYLSLLKFEAASSKSVLYNTGISDYRHSIKEFTAGDKYIFRIKYGVASSSDDSLISVVTTDRPVNLTIGLCNLDENGTYRLTTPIFKTSMHYDNPGKELKEDAEDYIYTEVTALSSFSYNELVNDKIGIIMTFDYSGTYYIKDLQFFKKVEVNNELVLPGKKELFAKAITMYCYYMPNDLYCGEEDIEYLYKADTPWSAAVIKYNTETFEKVRTLQCSQSNRYNLLMDLCELFECWVDFDIEHELDGTIKIDSFYRQKKQVTFRDYLGKENFTGFKYGINLKDINRKIESNNIVSKIVVKNNSNQFAQNGFCTIARADENYCKENFIYDFSYYIRSKLLSFDAVNNDLYMPKYINHQEGIKSPQKYLGYYKELKYLNQNRDTLINEQSTLVKDIPQYNSDKQTYENQAERASEGSRDKQLDIVRMTTFPYDHFLNLKDDPWWDNDKFLQTMVSIAQYRNSAKKYRALAEEASKLLEEAEQKFADNRHKLDALRDEKQKLHEEFYAKYSRFIQEGTWIKEDYVDDNLYYLDAENVLREASQPKVSYTINVLDLSQLDEYQGYTFDLGDKTFIEDLEFFGWDFDHSAPYKEEIVVTELTLNLDSPEQNVIKVQNYKSNFEDLFQRMTATTQALEYSNGKYSKTSDTIDEEGKIKVDVLQNSITGNSLKLQNAKDQSVIWDDTGITTTCLSKPNEVVRIFSGGIMMSKDGGNSWVTGISGDGINANYIVTGQLDTQKIRILNGNEPSFLWDSTGINAYYFEVDKKTGNPQGYNPNRFVRFDRHGIYSIIDKPNYNPDLTDNPEKTIQEDSPFSLTWNGFQIHSLHDDGGQIRITPTDDIELIRKSKDSVNTLIKIGLLSSSGSDNLYGIRIKDEDNNTVMETGSHGRLWLKDALYIGNDDMPSTQNVSLGFLPERPFTPNEKSGAQQVFNASNNFIVYADGKIEAKEGTFTGEIHAESGDIGGVTISSIISNVEGKVDLLAPQGTIFSVRDNIPEPEKLIFKAALSGIDTQKITNIIWSGSNTFGEEMEDLSGKEGISFNEDKTSIELSYNFFKENSLRDKYYLEVTVNYNDAHGPATHSDAIAITAIRDKGQEEESNDILMRIESTGGDIFKNNVGSTELTARLYQYGHEIDTDGEKYIYTWTGENFTTLRGKTITLYAFQISNTLTLNCEIVEKNEIQTAE